MEREKNPVKEPICMDVKVALLQFLRFGIVGFIATIIHYGIYWQLLRYMNTSISYTIGYIFSFFVNFFLTSYFTFKKKATMKKGVGFALSHGLNYLLHIGLLNMFLWIGISKDYAPIPVFFIVIPTNFILIRAVLNKE